MCTLEGRYKCFFFFNFIIKLDHLANLCELIFIPHLQTLLAFIYDYIGIKKTFAKL